MRRVLDEPQPPYRDKLLTRAKSGGGRPVDRMLRALLDAGAFEDPPAGQPGRASDNANTRSGSV